LLHHKGFLLVLLLASFRVDSLAGGILHVFPPQVEGELMAVARPAVTLSRSLATVSEFQIEYDIDQIFFNNNEYALNGVFIFPLGNDKPRGDAEVWVDSVKTAARVVSPADFFPTLRRLATSAQDPSLLGLAGRHVLMVDPVAIGARQQKAFKVKFDKLSGFREGKIEVLLPLDGEKYSLGPIGEHDIRVRFKVSQPVRYVFSPSHHISMLRESPNRCLVTVRQQNKREDSDFHLIAAVSRDTIDMRLLTHKAPGSPGTFMVLISPGLATEKTEEREKDVVFVMDASDSLGLKNLNLAKRTVISGLERLRSGDRFNVLAVGASVRRMADNLVPAGTENLHEAAAFVDAAKPRGGTDLYNGLIAGLEQLRSRRRPSYIMLVGDGRPTVGITEPDSIVEDVRRYNSAGARILALMGRIGSATKGSSLHFADNMDFDSVLSRFFMGLSTPVLSEATMGFEGVAATEVHPNPIPDLFGGQGLMALGRYTTNQDVSAKARLRARTGDKVSSTIRPFEFPAVDAGSTYLPAMWAMQRIAALLEEEWLRSPAGRARQEINDLAQSFGFRTPQPVGVDRVWTGRRAAAANPGRLYWTYKTSHVVSDVRSDRYRRVNGRVFRGETTKWIETALNPAMSKTRIAFMGDDYFSLLRESPALGAVLALGPELAFVHRGAAIEVTAER
jgi:Ca-activated chloride channel family protein